MKYAMGEAGSVYKSGSLVAQATSCVPVVVVMHKDWLELVACIKGWQPTHPCESGCSACREDAAIMALIKRIEAANA